jgi:hypothetical protein
MKTAEASSLFVGGIEDTLQAACQGSDYSSSDSNVVTSVIVALLFLPFGIYFSLALVAFFVEFHQFLLTWNLVSWQRSHDVRQQQQDYYDSTSLQQQQEEQQQHDPKREEQIRQQLNISIYNKNETSDKNHDNEATLCSICLTEFQDKEEISSIQNCHCSGKFHSQCLSQWLLKKSSCPYCRYDVLQTQKETPASITASLELASFHVEHIFMSALTYFGELISSFT